MSLARAKFGYLTYNDMLIKITNEQLNEYDICYTKDTHECYIVSENKIPIAIKSKVQTYSSVSSAEIALNSSIDTYEGQIVAIKYNDRFRAYIVEKNTQDFYVTPLDLVRDTINYDDLGNRPIITIKGTMNAPIIIGELSEGMYYVSGQYIFTSNDNNINFAMKDVLFITDGNGNIKKINGKNIINYTISDEGVQEDSYVTEEYIKRQNFATMTYVDEKTETATYNDIANLF